MFLLNLLLLFGTKNGYITLEKLSTRGIYVILFRIPYHRVMNEHGDYLLFAGVFGLISVVLCIVLIDVIGEFPKLTALYILPWVGMTAGGVVINKKEKRKNR